MKILYYDCFSGISGDMNLGALIDLGVPFEYIKEELSKLSIAKEFEVKSEKQIKNGIEGTKFDVILTGNKSRFKKVSQNSSLSVGHTHSSEHVHRNLKDIEIIVNDSFLSEKVKERAMKMFIKIAEAEAKVHGTTVDKIHFHEVGAIDSIVDIIGASIALEYLKVDKIISSPVQVGGGFVKCAHGTFPVPVPAVTEILQNIPLKSGIVSFETTTPTGAVILACNTNEFSDKNDFIIKKLGYGLGTKDFGEVPNVLRVYLGEIAEPKQKQYILETNIDDMNPELYQYLEEKLFLVGALDVFKTPIIMKKGRAAIKLSILTSQKKESAVLDVLFRESTTIGLRKYEIEKILMPREFEKIQTKYGEITIKKAMKDGKVIKYKAEYEECKKIAFEKDIPITEIYKEVAKIVDNRE